MQRSKASVSVEVKQVIGALCRLLAATGLDSVPAPETFRRAKFGGGPEVEGQFWKLLANILQRTGIVSSEDSSQLRGDLENRKLVAAGLWQTGYYADWMCGREAGEDEGLSSRDLLLALGWLLGKGTLEKLLTRRVQQLDQTLLTSLPVNSQVSHELQLDLTSLRRLHWLVGYLRHQRRILLFMIEERAQLLHAVFSASLPSAVSSSSGYSSAALKEDCVCIRHLCDLLETYLSWKQVETVFWTWMDSVVDCQLTEPVAKTSVHTTRVCHHKKQEREKLDDMLWRLPTAKACRIRLQDERSVSDTSTAERLHDSTKAPDTFPASEAAEFLVQTEALLLERRDRQRLANRMQLQEMIGELDGLVLIPP